MTCVSCSSVNLEKFSSETMIHRTGVEALAHSDVNRGVLNITQTAPRL